MQKSLRFLLLGLPEIFLNETAVDSSMPNKARALLYFLAMSKGQQTRERLANLLWPDRTDALARSNLRKTISKLPDFLEEYLTITSDRLQFQAGVYVDALDFRARVDAASNSVNINELEAAVSLYRGEFLSQFYVRGAPEYEGWQMNHRANYRELAIDVLSTLSREYERQGKLKLGIQTVKRLLDIEPWRESGHRHLMSLYARAGQRELALAQYNLCSHLLAEELGVSPSRQTQELYEQIRDNLFERVPLSPSPIQWQTTGEHVIIDSGQAEPTTRIPTGLPVPATPLVGRSAELGVLQRRFAEADCKLFTITGVGGVGKTRLALAFAESYGAHFRDGVY